MMLTRSASFFGLLLSLAAFGSSARAESVDALLREGVQLRREGRDDEALDVFRRAHAAAPGPRTAAQLALAEQALGRWVEAEAGLLEALASPNDPWIAKNDGALQAALERVRHELGSLRIETNVQGATIRVDGASVGTAPLEQALRARAGPVAVEVIDGNQTIATREVVVPADGEITAIIDAPPRESQPEVQAPPPTAPARDEPKLVLNGALSKSAPTVHDSSVAPEWLGWTLVATASGLLAAGVVAHVVRENAGTHYNDEARCFHDGMSRDQRCGDIRDRFETAHTLTITSYALSAAALGGALAVFLWPKPEQRGHVACIDARVSERGAYVATRMSF